MSKITYHTLDISTKVLPYLPPYIHRMIDHIYVGDHRAQIDYDTFDLVVNLNYPENGVKKGDYVDTQYSPKTRLIKVGIEDSDTANLSPFVNELTDTMRDYVNHNKRILLYSKEGTGRSAAILSSYLIKRYKFNTSDLMNMYRSSNYHPTLNMGFVRQLASLSEQSRR